MVEESSAVRGGKNVASTRCTWCLLLPTEQPPSNNTQRGNPLRWREKQECSRAEALRDSRRPFRDRNLFPAAPRPPQTAGCGEETPHPSHNQRQLQTLASKQPYVRHRKRLQTHRSLLARALSEDFSYNSHLRVRTLFLPSHPHHPHDLRSGSGPLALRGSGAQRQESSSPQALCVSPISFAVLRPELANLLPYDPQPT